MRVAQVASVTVGEAFRPPARAQPIRKRNRLPLADYVGVKAYSLTLATAARKAWFSDEVVVGYCLDALHESSERCGFDVYAYCFMPDHLHLLVASCSEDIELIDFVKRFKQKTGYWFSRRPGSPTGSLKASPTGLWQKSYYDHIVRSEEGLRQAAEYVLANPVAAGLADDAHPYPFSGSFVWPELNLSQI